jgi:hypothetical protein
LESIWAILEGCRKAAGKWSNSSHQPIGEETELPSGCWPKRGNFSSFCLKRFISVYIIKKSKTQKNVKNSQQLLSYLFSITSYGTTFSQTQTSTTFPLKITPAKNKRCTNFLRGTYFRYLRSCQTYLLYTYTVQRKHRPLNLCLFQILHYWHKWVHHR